MEVRGIGPLSESLSERTSPITADLLLFPLCAAERQAAYAGSFIYLFTAQSLTAKVPRQSRRRILERQETQDRRQPN